MTPKVFCLGFQKSGTSSLGIALSRLGYRVAGYWQFRDLSLRSEVSMDDLLIRAKSLVGEFDAFKDTPWPVLYRQLDALYPHSKFIHIVRNPKRWIASAVGDFKASPNPIHQTIYGSAFPAGNETAWIDRYERHNAEVVEYFYGRPADFISLNLEQGEVTWEAICSFLGHPVPNEPWPHANTARQKHWKMKWSRLLSRLGLGPLASHAGGEDAMAHER